MHKSTQAGKAPTMNSFADLYACARQHLQDHIDPAGGRSFQTYDRLGPPDEFQPLDALAPALLHSPVEPSVVVSLFSETSEPHAKLRATIDRLLAETAEGAPDFEDLDLDDHGGPWGLVREVLVACDDV